MDCLPEEDRFELGLEGQGEFSTKKIRAFHGGGGEGDQVLLGNCSGEIKTWPFRVARAHHSLEGQLGARRILLDIFDHWGGKFLEAGAAQKQ